MLEFLGSQPQFARIVGSREDLIEKLLIPTDDLDDVAVEIVKLLLRAQLGDQAGHARRHYERTDGEHLVFRVSEPGRAPAWYQVPAASYRHALAVASGALAARPLEVNEQLARRLLQGVRAGPSPELADDGDSRLIGIVERARYQAAFGAVAAETFSAAWCDTLTEPAILPSTHAPFVVVRYLMNDSPPLHLAVTSGLGAARAKWLEDQHPRVEFAVFSPVLGPRIVFALSCLAHVVHDPGRSVPLREWDHVTFQRPIQGGIAGAVLRPFATPTVGGKKGHGL
jgi:hypothetical protein